MSGVQTPTQYPDSPGELYDRHYNEEAIRQFERLTFALTHKTLHALVDDNGVNINLRCACLNVLYHEALYWDNGLHAACDELDWIEDRRKQYQQAGEIESHIYEYLTRMKRIVTRLKEHSYRYLETLDLPHDEYQRRMDEIREM